MTNLTDAAIDRLLKIEAAAKAWRRSLEDDGWTRDAIEQGICRPGMRELMQLIPQGDADDGCAALPKGER